MTVTVDICCVANSNAGDQREKKEEREREEAKATEKEIYSMIALDASSNKMAGNVDQSN